MEIRIIRKNDLVAAEYTVIENSSSLIITEKYPIVGIKIDDFVFVPCIYEVNRDLEFRKFKILAPNHDTGKYDTTSIKSDEPYATEITTLYPNNYEIIPTNKLYSACEMERYRISQNGVRVDETYVPDHHEEEQKRQMRKTLRRLKRLVPFISN